jgi:hypothetical protein
MERFTKGFAMAKLVDMDPAPLLMTPRMEAAIKRAAEAELQPKEHVELAEVEPEQEEENDPFANVIDRISKSESPRVRAAIQRTGCFARLWFNAEDDSFCDEMECEIRRLCEAAYTKAMGVQEAPVVTQQTVQLDHIEAKVMQRVLRALEQPGDELHDDLARVVQGRKFQKKKKIYHPTTLRSKSKRLKRRHVPYLDRGLPVDEFLRNLWLELGSPSALPERFRYLVSATRVQRSIAAEWFRNHYGDGLLVSKRLSMWTFFYEGMQVCRCHATSASVSNVDCNPFLVEWVHKNYRWPCYKVAIKDPSHKHQFFTGRFRIEDVEQARMLAKAILETITFMEVI